MQTNKATENIYLCFLVPTVSNSFHIIDKSYIILYENFHGISQDFELLVVNQGPFVTHLKTAIKLLSGLIFETRPMPRLVPQKISLNTFL